jgi:hypothetical protein
MLFDGIFINSHLKAAIALRTLVTHEWAVHCPDDLCPYYLLTL